MDDILSPSAMNHDIVTVTASFYGEAWLGRLNLPNELRGREDAVLWKFDKAPVPHVDFVLPVFDADLVRMILDRDARGGPLDAIMDRIETLGGTCLFWT